MFSQLVPSTIASSPRTRRYFHVIELFPRPAGLFSAHAEVFPLSPLSRMPSLTLLRARGGISGTKSFSGGSDGSSPRTRRYFQCWGFSRDVWPLFSAHAEVFPLRLLRLLRSRPLLRARGGISAKKGPHPVQGGSSPRTRRYFPHSGATFSHHALFSAHAEVFPRSVSTNSVTDTLFRARGGISPIMGRETIAGNSSPRTRRYFLADTAPPGPLAPFSARTEVFPHGSLLVRGSTSSFPRIRSKGAPGMGHSNRRNHFSSVNAASARSFPRSMSTMYSPASRSPAPSTSDMVIELSHPLTGTE